MGTVAAISGGDVFAPLLDVAFGFCNTAAALACAWSSGAAALACAWSNGAVFDLRQYCEHEHKHHQLGQNHLENLSKSLKTKRAAITFFFFKF